MLRRRRSQGRPRTFPIGPRRGQAGECEIQVVHQHPRMSELRLQSATAGSLAADELQPKDTDRHRSNGLELRFRLRTSVLFLAERNRAVEVLGERPGTFLPRTSHAAEGQSLFRQAGRRKRMEERPSSFRACGPFGIH